jgi:hypothetical protein
MRHFEKQGVCHSVALPFTLKKYLKVKEELWKLKYISPCKNIIFKKINPLKQNQNPSRYYYNSITNLKFQHKPKKYHLFKKSPYQK